MKSWVFPNIAPHSNYPT